MLARGGIRAAGNRLAYSVMRAELDAIVCSGAMRGKQHTYVERDALGAAIRAYTSFAGVPLTVARTRGK